MRVCISWLCPFDRGVPYLETTFLSDHLPQNKRSEIWSWHFGSTFTSGSTISFKGTNLNGATDTLKCKEIMRFEINFVVFNCQTHCQSQTPLLLSTWPVIGRLTLSGTGLSSLSYKATKIITIYWNDVFKSRDYDPRLKFIPKYLAIYSLPTNSSVTSSPMRTNGAQYFTALKRSDSRMDFMALFRASLALRPRTSCW